MYKLYINYDNSMGTCIKVGVRTNVIFTYVSVSLLWQPIQVNPALEITRSTGVNDHE